jgi:hypothetical protein
MRCIFCRTDSSSSRSEEHIIPHSLGNRRHTLKPGIVCDACNNYFSREVERPFLNAPAIQHLRFHQVLASRKGSIPPIAGLIRPDIPATLYRDYRTGGMSVDIPTEFVDKFSAMPKGELIFPMSGLPPANPVISRFMAKVALEAMAYRLAGKPEGLTYLCDEAQLDLLRDHARRGKHPVWPVHSRRIYDPDSHAYDGETDLGQTVHEFDFLITSENEWYFVLAIFGLELTINLGGPELKGYQRWLAENKNVSPLYSGKNAIHPMPGSKRDE